MSSPIPPDSGQERRRYRRWEVAVELQIVSEENDSVIGKVVNLSAHGLKMKLDAQSTLCVGRPIRVSLRPPGSPSDERRHGPISATIIWTGYDETGAYHSAGLRFVHNQQPLIETLIEKFGTRSIEP